MSEIIEHSPFHASIKFNVTIEQAKKMYEECKAMELTDWQDEETYKLIKQQRTAVNKVDTARHAIKRKLKEPADEHNKKVEALSKDIEFYTKGSSEWLNKQLKVRDDMLVRIKREEDEREQRELERRDRLAREIKWDKPVYLLRAMTLEDFEKEYQSAKAIHENNLKIEAENKIKLEEFQQAQQQKLDDLERENRELKKRQDEELRIKASEAQELKRALVEKQAKEQKEHEEAQKLAKDDSMMKEVQELFPTLPLAWAEIVRLRKEELF